jgi:hypothetical protein
MRSVPTSVNDAREAAYLQAFDADSKPKRRKTAAAVVTRDADIRFKLRDFDQEIRKTIAAILNVS